jgi:energy-coupling factor transport system substrate-specific component
MNHKIRSGVAYGAIAIVGTVAFIWPFWFPSEAGASSAHDGDAWIWAMLLGVLTVGALMLEVGQRRINGATIATLGVIAAMNALLRLLDLPGGGNAMFFLTVLAAAAFGARFGTLLGLTAMAASAIITAGIGPWMPYQMLALAAMGAAAGAFGKVIAPISLRKQVVALAMFAWFWAFIYGATMNLWFWPLIRDGGRLSYEPGLGFFSTARRYWSYYLVDSFAWDAAGALTNAVFILVLGVPLLRSLRRIAHRLEPSTVWA